MPANNHGFEVKSYYKSLNLESLVVPLDKCLKGQGALPHIAFFTWSAALGKIPMVDNLRGWGFTLVNWYYLCEKKKRKKKGDSNHLLIHCGYSSDLWHLVFNLFGVLWAMPINILELLHC
jgi:hypothetical protein